MENRKDTKGFYDYKNTLRALSDGLSLATGNARMMLKVLAPVLVVGALLSGGMSLLGLKCSELMLVPGVVTDWMPVIVWMSVAGLFFLLCSILFDTQVFVLFSMYVDKGFLPTVTWRSIWKPTFRKLLRVFSVTLWSIFLLLVYGAFTYYLAVLSRWTLVVMVPGCFFLCIWLMNQFVAFLVEPVNLWEAVCQSWGVTVRAFGSFLSSLILILLAGTVILWLCMIPSLSCELIFSKALQSLAEGDAGDLPAYFHAVYFLTRVFAMLVAFILSAVMWSCWSMVYGAALTRIRQKRQKAASDVPSSI